MSAYLYPIKMAIFIFPFLALVLSIPFFIQQYRKYGAFVLWRGIIIYSFIFYLLSAFFLVILPLPSRASVAVLTTPRYNLYPFEFVRQFLAYSSFRISEPSTYLTAIRESSFIQPLFNIILTLPFGIYLRYYYKRNWWQTMLLTFCLSLFFELTQLSGDYGFYPRPYRLFDVDDLMLNTIGGLLGFGITPLISWLFPTHAQMEQTAYERGKRVSYSRRFIALLIDYFLILLAGATLDQVVRTLHWNVMMRNGVITYIISVIIVFGMIPMLFKGSTVGKMVVRIRIVGENDQPVKVGQLLLRQGLLYGIVVPCFEITSYYLGLTGTAPEKQLDHILLLAGIFGAFAIVFALHLLLAMITRQDRLFYERLSKTHQISTVVPKVKV